MANLETVNNRGLNLNISSEAKQTVSFEDEASMISRCFLFYLNPLFRTGAERLLAHEDLGGTSRQDQCNVLHKSFSVAWAAEMKKPKRSLWNTLLKTVGVSRMCLAIGLYGVFAASSFIPILILNALVKHFEGTSTVPTALLWIYVALLFVVPMVGSVASAQNNVMTAHIGTQFRNALIGEIYRKSLVLSPASRQKTSTGQIVNMFSTDTTQIQNLMFFIGMILFAPFQIAVALALIYQQVGNATWVGLAFMLILMPINGFVFASINSIRKKKVKITDSRVKMMNEILAGIRIIKFYAWEDAFRGKVNAIRDAEMTLLTQLAYIIAIGFSLVLMSAPIVQPILVFFTYIKLGYQLDAATAFTTISLFNVMRFPFAFLPMGLAQWSQTKVSLKRMSDFLASDELDSYIEKPSFDFGSIPSSDDVIIRMEGVTMNWVMEDAATAASNQAVQAIAPVSTVVTVAKPATYGAVEKNEPIDPLKPATTSLPLPSAPPRTAVMGESGKFQLNRSVHTLMDVNITVKRGQLVAVVGSVGSGKSSLLSGILGELHLSQGKVFLAGNVAYCDQRPWILNATLRDNVLFGLPYDEERFDLALHASALDDDIKVLPGGILTEIGERGINLSGGQKARVALARAVYRNADVYLFDDPLSAVDAHVGEHIFQECLVEALAGKTRVLVTHHVHFLPQCDLVIVLEDGRVKICGTYDELKSSGLDLQSVIPNSTDDEEEEGDRGSLGETPHPSEANLIEAAAEEEAEKEKEEEAVESKTNETESATTVTKAVTTKVDKSSKAMNQASVRRMKSKKDQASVRMLARNADTRSSGIMSMEERDKGNVAVSAYTYYIAAGGWFLYYALFMVMSTAAGLDIGASFWLSYWSQSTVKESERGSALSSEQNLYFLNIYALISMLGVVGLTVRSLILAHHRLGTSLKLHSDLMVSILGAPISFFDITPLGRILNRFSSDIAVVDESLSQTLSQLVNSVFTCISAAVAIAAATSGTFLILLVPLYFLYDRVQRFFRRSNTEIQRLQSVSLSPIYADFSQALVGVSSIRAYGLSSQFILQMEESVNKNSIAAIMQQLAGQWLAIRLDLIGASISLFIAALAVGAGGDFIPAGYLALALSYSLNLTSFLKFAVRMVATTEAQMNSVERIKFYAEEVEQEGVMSAKRKPPPEDWPTKGVVEAMNVSLRYRDGPLVLNNVSFTTESSEKIGIAGRTGSGKSSLMAALFRIEELHGGVIRIDGKDCSQIPLKILRSKIGIIPQDPVMFSASVRFNLDPFDKHTDQEIWDILSVVELKDAVQSLPSQLLEQVAESGENFSAGQRQLICIARALLRRPKVLVLDEATASVDNETDSRMQTMIKERFKECTVLTIAHRLHTIVDSDRIMVLENGELAELDSPKELMSKSGGLFQALWERHQLSHGKKVSSRDDMTLLAASLDEEAKDNKHNEKGTMTVCLSLAQLPEEIGQFKLEIELELTLLLSIRFVDSFVYVYISNADNSLKIELFKLLRCIIDVKVISLKAINKCP
eukprot:gene2837-5584_t